jgi:hypothetical protein
MDMSYKVIGMDQALYAEVLKAFKLLEVDVCLVSRGIKGK